MGIRGIVGLIRAKNLLVNYRLHDCTMVIDGALLAHELYFRYSETCHMFGGDFDLFVYEIQEFFDKLKQCNIVPVVVIDGSLNPTLEKIETKLIRMQGHLEKSLKVSQGCFQDTQIYPMMATAIFCNLLKKLEIRLYRTPHESEYIICKIANDLQCPILTRDGDFFIENLPAGVLHLDDLLNNFEICNDKNPNEENSYNYFACKIFKLKHFQNVFQGPCHLSMLPIAVPILDPDRKVQKDLPIQIKYRTDFSGLSFSHQKICRVLAWIAQFNSVDSLLTSLSSIPRSNTPLIDYIRANRNRFDPDKTDIIVKKLSVDQYFCDNLDKLFLKQSSTYSSCPDWLLRRYVNATLNVRFTSIISLNQEIFKPLVEDFKFKESSSQCSYTLNEYIAGMILRTDSLRTDPPTLSRFCRREDKIVVDTVQPRTNIGNIELPTIDQLEQLSEDRRRDLFFRILDLEPAIFTKLETCLSDGQLEGSDLSVNQEYRNLAVFQLITLIYLLRQFEGDIYLELIYAIFTNIVLNGNMSRGTMGQLIKFTEENQRDSFVISLIKLNQIPKFSESSPFNPAIVHYYNSYLSCFFSMDFLLQLLNLNQILSIEVSPFLLAGTFIYNLSITLSKQKAPLSYLITNILGHSLEKFDKSFREMLDLILKCSQRKLKFYGSNDVNVVPQATSIDIDITKLSLNDQSNDLPEKKSNNISERFVVRINNE